MSVPNDNRAAEQRHFLPLDGLRGIAILLVLLVHTVYYAGPSPAGRMLDGVARAGWTGVTLFFVLSGFLITGILLDTRGRPHYFRDFYGRRSLRIFPLYYAFLAFYFLIATRWTATATVMPAPASDVTVYYWTYLSNMVEWLSGRAIEPGPLEHLWSLAVEEQVYLFWPLLIALVPTHRVPLALVTLCIVSFGWRVLSLMTTHAVLIAYQWTPSNVEAFAVGGLVAWLARHSRATLATWAPRATVATALMVVASVVALRHLDFWKNPPFLLTVGTSMLVALFGAAIGWMVTSPENAPHNRLLASTALRHMGRYSYAIYLFHIPLVALLAPRLLTSGAELARNTSMSATMLLAAGTFVASYGLAFCSWHLLEKHCIALKRHFPLSSEVPHEPHAGDLPALMGTRRARSATAHRRTPSGGGPVLSR